MLKEARGECSAGRHAIVLCCALSVRTFKTGFEPFRICVLSSARFDTSVTWPSFCQHGMAKKKRAAAAAKAEEKAAFDASDDGELEDGELEALEAT
eukprot:2041589-Prymnesium_polylepis.1